MPSLRLDNDSNTNEPYLEFYQHLMTVENDEVAQVISVSYGDDEQVRRLLRLGRLYPQKETNGPFPKTI